MMAGRFARILNILKKWLSRLARRSAGLFFVALSSLRRFAAGLLSLSNRKLIARFPSGVRLRSQEDIVAENSPICPSLLPPGQMGLEVAGEPSSPSDDPYTGTHSRPSRPLRKGTAIPPLEVPSTTTTGYTSATETDGLHQGSVSSLHLSLEMGESSVNNRMLLTDGPLQESSSPGPSRLVGPHEVSAGHSRQSGYMDDARSVNTTRTPSMRHLAPSMSRSQHASDSRVSVSSNRSLTRSIAGSESRQAAYRPHKGPVHSRPASVHGSTVYQGSPNTISVPLDLPVQALPVSDSGYDHYVHYTAPPGNNELPGSEVVVVYGAQYDAPLTSCMVANDVRRYGRCSPRNPEVHDITVPAMSLTAHDMPIPEGWTTFVHPEGARYYVNQEKRTFTEMDIRQEDIGKDIEYYMVYLLEELRQTLEQRGIVLDMSQIDLVVEPKVYEVDGESVVCCYYFANHHDRCLFWLDDFNPEDIISECKGVENLSHARLAIEAQYWRHWDYFPSLCPVTQNTVDELKGVLMHAACDHLTSMQSSLPFDATELKDHLDVVDRIKVHPTPPADQIMQQGHAAISTSPAAQSMRRGHAAIVIGRLMYTFTHNHFVNYHGEDCVRLMYEQTVHGWKYEPSALMFILAPLLFFDPVAQIQELHKIFVDEVACTTRWNLFCAKFKGQLQDSNLLATVLLNANVGFLAINTVDRGGRNVIQMASYMSLVTSLGSIVLGLFFVSHDRTSGTNTATEAAVFLARLHNNKHGMEKLAIIYSLPKALLMWGMAFFFAAFSIDWWTSGDAISKTIVGTVTVAVFVMIANSIIRTRARTKWSLLPPWLRGSIDLKMLSGLVNARRDAMEFMRTKIGLSQANPGGDVQMHSTSQSTLATGFQPEMPGHNNHPYPTYPPVQPYHSTASVHSQQPHDGNSVLPSLDPHIGPGVLPGAGALQQIQEDIPTDFQDQSTTEARYEPHSALLGGHFNTSPSSASEEITSTAANAICHSDALPTTATILPEHELQTAAVADTDAPIPTGALCTEEREDVTYTENVVEEPGELEHRQPSPSPPPLPNEVPRIVARGATGDDFQHAPVAPRWTLQDGQDILEEPQE